MRKILVITTIIVFSFTFRAEADEGMWLLPLIEKLNIGKMTELGLQLSAEDIYSLNQASLKDAIIIFGGGCTGEIVSPQGLILTNHHCGYSSIQSHSTVEHDYLHDGFWAMTMAEELPNPSLSATFLISITDVTDRILADVTPGMSEVEREATVIEARYAVEAEASKGNDYRVQVSSFYGGNYYYLLVYERYTDVRLVGAPPSSIGKYGSDSDNWEWPRHTGDFSVFRVYTGPDGKPAHYSAENIPLQPKRYLPISIKELNKGDFTMVLGYPGRTTRYMTSSEIDEQLQIYHPVRIKVRGIKQDIWLGDMQADPKVNIQYSNKYFTSSNYWKFSIGQKAGLEELNVKTEKEQIEERFNKWVNTTEERRKDYGEALDLIRSAIEDRKDYYKAIQYYNESIQGCELYSISLLFSSLADAIRSGDDNMIKDAVSLIRTGISDFYKDYNSPTDKKTTKAMLKLLRDDLPDRFHPGFFHDIVDRKFRGDIDRYVDNMFDKSIFPSEEKLNSFLDKPLLKVLEKDPVYIMSESILLAGTEISRIVSNYNIDLTAGRRLWIAALMKMAPEEIRYPDANSTMRLSYGTVQDYDPRDGVTYKYYTTLSGVIEKYVPGDYEFDLPQRLINLYDNKDFGEYASSEGYMPVCFLTTNDITGGNSGSPVLNANGELIGLAFDGNWESMSGDIAYEPDIQRTIAVDIRYVLWIIDKYAGASHLIEEMTIVQ